MPDAAGPPYRHPMTMIRPACRTGRAAAGFFTLVVLATTVNVGAAPAQDQFAVVRKKIEAALISEQIPSLAVAVARYGRILWAEGFGWADRERRVPATEHTMYNVGSISKPMTATGLMLLVQRGHVALDRPANEYLGAARLRAHVGDADQATVRRLTNHTSGLPRHSTIHYADQPFAPLPIEEFVRRYGHLVREPGELYEYSNLGYRVLGHLIARVTERPYADFMRQEVFIPLGMTHTAVGSGARLEEFYAISYARDQTPVPMALPYHPGAGDIFSSVHDLVRFGMLHLRRLQPDQRDILSDSSVSTMQRSVVATGQGDGYGIGWSVDSERYGYRRVYHTGSNGYGTAILALLPDEGICVSALANRYTAAVVTAADEVLAALLPEYAARLRSRAEPPPVAVTAPFRPSESWLGHWVGAIETDGRRVPVELWFKDSGDIHVQLGGQLRTLVSGARIQAGYFRGSFAGDLDTDDLKRFRPYALHLRVKLRGDALNGSVTASTTLSDLETSATRRVGGVLSYWIELKRRAAP